MNDSLCRTTDQELLYELSYYTLAHSDPSFIHQHVVDAFAAQHADETTSPIAIVFALVGLYLHVEKGFNGKQVQRCHAQLARRRNEWMRLTPPAARGAIEIRDVLAASAGTERDAAIHRWCASVWDAWSDSRGMIAALVRDELGIE